MTHPAVRDLFQTLVRQEAFHQLVSSLTRREPGPFALAGLTPAAKALYLVLTWQATEKPILVFTDGNQSAEQLEELCNTFFHLLIDRPGVGEPQLLPALDVLPGQRLSPHTEISGERAIGLWRLAASSGGAGSAPITIAPVASALLRTHDPEYYRRLALDLRTGDELPLESIESHLQSIGYEKHDPVEMVGEYSIRGGILDVFSVESSRPLRIEFFGDEIESIRRFDPESQRSVLKITEARVLPMVDQPRSRKLFHDIAEKLEYHGVASPGDPFPGWEFSAPLVEPRRHSVLSLAPDALIVIDEPDQIRSAAERLFKRLEQINSEHPDAAPLTAANFFEWSELEQQISQSRTQLALRELDLGVGSAHIATRPSLAFHNNMPVAVNEAKTMVEQGYRVAFFAPTNGELERRDALIVASVSCIYGLGSPEAYYGMMMFLEKGQKIKREDVTRRLVDILYERTNGDFRRGTFRVRGDVIEVFPTYDDMAYRIELWGDEISSLTQIDPLFGTVKQKYMRLPIYPKTHYVMKEETRASAVDSIKKELAWWEAELEKQGRLVEAQRIHQRTMFDLEMIKAMGFCHGIENYSRHFTGRLPGEPPPTLLDYFPRDFLMFIDESHQTVPQLRGMYAGDRSRKETLVEYGFRMPSALDNRPLTFEEFEHRTNQLVYVSATPGPYELTKSSGVVVEQIIRPTGLIDPPVEIRPVKGQIDDLLHEIRARVEIGERVLVTTLTKRMSEDLAEYYAEVGVKCRYMHSEIETLERVKILRDLRKGEFDVLIGINLLREGLDLPEVSLVAILDADKEGFLRSTGSLIQTIGRCARHLNGRVILYADRQTDSMKRAIDETSRRRAIQTAYNEKNGITPESIVRPLDMTLAGIVAADYADLTAGESEGLPEFKTQEEVDGYIGKLESDMREAAKKFEFEKAAKLRDTIKELRTKEFLFA